MHYIMFVIELGCFRIVTHSCPARFQQIRVFIKFTAFFFISRAKLMNAKAINVSGSIFKIK